MTDETLGECPRCGRYGKLHEVDTPVSKVYVCGGCMSERAKVIFKTRNQKAIRKGGCLKCGKPHTVCGKPNYINGLCTSCVMKQLIVFDGGG